MRSEGSQHVYSFVKGTIKDNISGEQRCMLEVGNIRGLERDDVVNYLLVPMRVTDKGTGKERTTGWNVHRIAEDCEVEVVDWNTQGEPGQ